MSTCCSMPHRHRRGMCRALYESALKSGAIVSARQVPVADRFWSRVAKSVEACWLWTGSKDDDGYGLAFFWHRRRIKAHRLSWELNRGPIPAGLDVLHSCDNPPCVRPDHLFLGTQVENMEDARRKGRLAQVPSETAAAISEAYRSGAAISAIRERFGVAIRTIYRAVGPYRREPWKAKRSRRGACR